MDSRTVKEPDAPSLLLNVDLSDRGSLKQRPGSKKFAHINPFAAVSPTNLNGQLTKGLFAYVYNDDFFLFVIAEDLVNSFFMLHIFNDVGDLICLINLSNPGFGPDYRFGNYSLEPPAVTTRKAVYSFAGAGRFVYFSSGEGNFFRLEIKDQTAPIPADFASFDRFGLTSNNFEVGNLDLVQSYVLDGIYPSSLSYFFDQLIATGFKRKRVCKLSLTVPSGEEKEHDVPPEQLLNAARDEMGLDPGAILVSEPFLWDSYPINDPGGFYWSFNENVIAALGVGTNIYVFCENNIYKILNHGSNSPRRARVAEATLVNANAYCYFKDYLFFVALDGCYIATPNSIQKVSFEMDNLWFGRSMPQITRYSESRIKDNCYPYFVDRQNMHHVHCVNDKSRQQIMVSLPSLGSRSNSMVWVYNYGDMLEQIGKGKWSIWTSGDQSLYTVQDKLNPTQTSNVQGALPADFPLTTFLPEQRSDADYNVVFSGITVYGSGGAQTLTAIATSKATTSFVVQLSAPLNPGNRIDFTWTASSYPGNGSTADPPYIATVQDTSYNIYNWGQSTEVTFRGKQRIFFANTPEFQMLPNGVPLANERTSGLIFEFGVSKEDLVQSASFDSAGVQSRGDIVVNYPFLVSLGRVGRVDSDGRIICSDVSVRRKQLSKNIEEESGAATVTAIVRSEGEGLKHFDATETDVEFSDTILNSQIGVSESTTSTLNTLKLGTKPVGTSSPLMSSEYFDTYARVDAPDEEGRSVYVDIYSEATDQPLRIDISEIKVYGNVKGGSQREQS